MVIHTIIYIYVMEVYNKTIPVRDKVQSEALQVSLDNDIIIEMDGHSFNQNDHQYIQNFAEILANDNELEVGSFELGTMKITINKLHTYEKELILCKGR